MKRRKQRQAKTPPDGQVLSAKELTENSSLCSNGPRIEIPEPDAEAIKQARQWMIARVAETAVRELIKERKERDNGEKQ